MKFHSFGAPGFTGSTRFFLVRLYPVYPVDPVRKIILYFVEFLFDYTD
jgi:hypothetical protein